MAFATISTRTTCFLVITFNTFRDIVMNNKANVWLVDTHTKSDSRNDNVAIFLEKTVLVVNPLFGV